MLIVGPLVFISVAYALLAPLELASNMFGISESAAQSIALLGILFALALAYLTAMEVTRVRLHGFEELKRGSGVRRTVRHGLLAVVCLAALAALASLLYEALLYGVEQGDSVFLALAVATTLALLWVVVRSAKAFVQGTRDTPS